jgi:hypothetical protein
MKILLIVSLILLVSGCAKEGGEYAVQEEEDYYILVDGKEYGPIKITTLKEWAREGRIPEGSLIRTSGGRWRRVSEFKGVMVKGRREEHPLASLSEDEERRLRRDLERLPVYLPDDDW